MTTHPTAQTITTTTTPARRTGAQTAGLVIAMLLMVTNLPSVLETTPDGEVGPPFSIMLLCTLLAVAGVVTTVLAWRGSAVATRVTAGILVVLVVTSLPAFFVDVPTIVKTLVGVSVLVTVAAIGLMFSPRREG